MDFNKQLAKELLNTLNGDTWYSSNFDIVINDIDADTAIKKLKGFPNSIVEIVYHMIQWKQFCIEKISGNPEFDIQMHSEEDWKRYNSLGDEEWDDLKSQFEKTTNELSDAMATVVDTRSEETVPGRKYSFFHLFVGIIEHEAVHTTQISYLKRLLQN